MTEFTGSTFPFNCLLGVKVFTQNPTPALSNAPGRLSPWNKIISQFEVPLVLSAVGCTCRA